MLETTRDLALSMGARWRDPKGPAVLGFADGLCARILTPPPGEVMAPASDAHIFSLVTRGEAHHTHWRDGKLILDGEVPSSSVNIVPAGQAPRWVTRGNLRLMHVYIPHQTLAQTARSSFSRKGTIEVIDPQFSSDDVSLTVAAGILHALEQWENTDHSLLDHLGHALVACIISRWTTAGRTDLTPPQTAPRTTDWRIRRLMDRMTGDLSQTISLADLAADVDLTVGHLITLFRGATGTSPHRWLVQRRVDAAAQMLVSGRTSITEIALSCGFSSSQHFATAFRQIKGMTPSDWRQTAGLALAPQPTGGTRKSWTPVPQDRSARSAGDGPNSAATGRIM